MMQLTNPTTTTAPNNTNPDHSFTEAAHSSTQVISSLHQDFIYKVSFDTYGRRMATCSGDRSVRVWDLQDNGEWSLSAQLQAHRAAVTSIAWAHPEYGCLLATCGSDHDAKIWEERSTTSRLNLRWHVKASLTEARRAVTCLEFAPRHFGLKLAVGSADGCVRVYEAVDINNLAQWPLAATLQAFGENHKMGCTSLSWCTGRFEPQTLVAGGSHCVIYRYMEAARAWQPILQLPSPEKGDVLECAWAPNVGRRFHYIASAEGDQLKVYKLMRDTTSNGDKAEEKTLTLESSQTIQANAWRCQWNVTGTVLASSGDGAVVQLWKPDSDGQFECVSTVQSSMPGQAEY